MKLLADLHISPRTVEFLRSLGHDVVRASEQLAPTSADLEIVEFAEREGRVVVTQDLDFSAIVALTGRRSPSIVSLRLASSRIEHVNDVLGIVLARHESDLVAGSIVVVTDQRTRRRMLPIE